MSSADKSKLDGVASGAEVNQNAFSNVVIGSTTVAADSKTDSLTLAGSNVTLTPDATNDKITIGITKANVTSALGYTPPTTNTTYSEATTSAAGLMSASDKSKLNGIAAGAQVNTITGIKGNAESSYRTGNVNITPANIGAVASSEKGAASGVVPLNSSSLIDSKYLPSYVDDVLEYENKSKFPTAGESGKIYVDTSAEENNTYRWSGTTYILIAKNTNTTYTLTKSGSTITLTGSDGATTSVADSNTTYSNATTSTAGLMSASDKSKLDGIAANANNYSLPTATSSVLGGVKTGSNITNSSGTISLTKANVTSALGYTPPTTNTTYSTGTTTTSGLTKLYTGTGTATDGTMTQNAINTALSGKAASSHTHTKSQITDFPTIPTVNNPTITITQAGATKGTFTLNQSGNTTIALTDNNTTYSVATTSVNGLMSASDKSKLDGIKKYTSAITGTGSATSFTVTHNLGTKNVIVQVYNSSGETVVVDTTRTSTAVVTLAFDTAPTTSETFTVLILGLA